MKRFCIAIIALILAAGMAIGAANTKKTCPLEAKAKAECAKKQKCPLKAKAACCAKKKCPLEAQKKVACAKKQKCRFEAKGKAACCPMAGCIMPKEKTALWNGEDFSGWKLYITDKDKDPKDTYSIKDGVIQVAGLPGGYMRTEADYCNYLLHVEWRWPGSGGNSGVLTHMSGPDRMYPKSFECQLASGHAGDIWLIGSGEKLNPLIGIETTEHAAGGPRVDGRRIKKLKESSEKPLGEWNTYEVICKNDWMLIFANGVLQNAATGMSNCCGKICLQSEGTPIEFRNIYIEPLE